MAIALKIEKEIEDAVIQLLEAESYISTNNIPVRNWGDVDEEMTGYQVVVHGNPAQVTLQNELGEAKEYSVEVNMHAFIHNTADEDIAGNLIYEFLFGFANQVTEAQLAAKLTSRTISGKWQVDSEQVFEERFRDRVASFVIYLS